MKSQSPRSLRQPWDSSLQKATCFPPSIRLASVDVDPNQLQQQHLSILNTQRTVDRQLHDVDVSQSDLCNGLRLQTTWISKYYKPVMPERHESSNGQGSPGRSAPRPSPRKGVLSDATFHGSVVAPTVGASGATAAVAEGHLSSSTRGHNGTGGSDDSLSTAYVQQMNWQNFSRQTELMRRSKLSSIVALSPLVDEGSASKVQVEQDIHVQVVKRYDEAKQRLESSIDDVKYRCEAFFAEFIEDDIWCLDLSNENDLVDIFQGAMQRSGEGHDDTGSKGDDGGSEEAGGKRQEAARKDAIATLYKLLREEVKLMTLKEALEDPEDEQKESAKKRAPVQPRRKSSTYSTDSTPAEALNVLVIDRGCHTSHSPTASSLLKKTFRTMRGVLQHELMMMYLS